MNIPLSERTRKRIERKVKSGEYASVSAVVREALRLLEDRDKMRLDRLRRQVAEGLADLEAGRYTEMRSEREIDEFFRGIRSRGRKRLAAARRKGAA